MSGSSEKFAEKTLQAHELEAMLAASKAVLQYSSFTESARQIFDQAKIITGATAGYVALLSDTGEENEVLFLDAGGAPCSVDPELPMPIRGLREQAYRTQETVYDNDFWNSEWTEFLPDGHVKMTNVMFAPLNIEGKTVGIMGLANKATDFTPRDAMMATAFGEFAAISLYNSRNLDVLRTTVTNLNNALQEVKTLKGIIPICAKCKKVRDDEGYWSQVEEYIHKHSDADFSHGLCPECGDEYLRELESDEWTDPNKMAH